MERIITDRAIEAYRAAWMQPRWAFRHRNGPTVLLQPRASTAIEAGATRVPLGDVTASVLNTKQELEVDGNVHTLVSVEQLTPEDIYVHTGAQSPHLDVATFLDEVGIATGIETERIFVHIPATGHIETAIAPSVAWVDPLVRRCALDTTCIQQFLLKWNIGNVHPCLLERLFGTNYGQASNGTPDAIKPFVAPVRVVLGTKTVHARYSNTVAELLDALPDVPIYLHGVQLLRCALCLWTLSPVSHGVIYLYLDPVAQVQTRTTIGAQSLLPRSHRLPAFVPCPGSFTGNAFAPALHDTPEQLAAKVPETPTVHFMKQLTLGEPMTVSRAQCIFRCLQTHFTPDALLTTLVNMALPGQEGAMRVVLASAHTMTVHPAFYAHIHQVARKLVSSARA